MRCATVQILSSGISQLEGQRTVVTVPREEIRQITLSHEPRSQRPFLRFFAGFMLVVIGLIFIIAAFMMAEGGVFLLQMKSVTFGIPLVPIGLWSMVGAGLWLVMGVFRGKYIFSIQTDGGTRKIFFEERTDIRDIRSFIERAKHEFGYDIDVSIMETMHF